MTSKIIEAIKDMLFAIRESGNAINGTTEKTNVLLNFRLSDLDLAEEETEVKKWYNEVIGENFTARLKVEQDHYLFLEYALKHKISEIQYFNKGEDITSRKYIVFSGDCINCINLLMRPDQNTMNVFMRSSDCLRLLAMDLLYCIKIMKNVFSRHGVSETENEKTSFWITSCQFYDRDKSLVEDILK